MGARVLFRARVSPQEAIRDASELKKILPFDGGRMRVYPRKGAWMGTRRVSASYRVSSSYHLATSSSVNVLVPSSYH